MKEKYTSALMQIREYRGLTRRELAELSGINFRSLQDYEQGHKDIASAKADTLLRVSLVLGCSMEELLQIPPDKEAQKNRVLTYYQMLTEARNVWVEEIKVYSREYRIHGHLKVEKDGCYLLFCYKGEVVKLPFNAAVSEQTLPWFADIALMMMESYVRDRIFQDREFISGEEVWNEL